MLFKALTLLVNILVCLSEQHTDLLICHWAVFTVRTRQVSHIKPTARKAASVSAATYA